MIALQIEFALIALIAAVSVIALLTPAPQPVWLVLAALYLMDLIAVTLLGRTAIASGHTALVPVKSLIWIWSAGWEYSTKYTARQIIGNVVMFIPAGLMSHKLLGGKPWLTTLLSAMALSLLIELTQFATYLGTLETDEVIFNVWGALIGVGIYQIVMDAAAHTLRAKAALQRLIPMLCFAIIMAIFCARPLYLKYFG